MRDDPRPETTTSQRSAYALFALACLCLVALVAAFAWHADRLEAAVQMALDMASGHTEWVIVAVIALMVLHNAIPVPAEAIAIAAGSVLGLPLGLAAVWVGAMIGAVLAFWMARKWGHDLVYRFLPRAARRTADRMTQYDAWPALLGLRLVPIISFNLVNYSAGLTSVPWRTYLWTTALGILPIAVISVGMGAQIETFGSQYLALAIVVLAVIALLRHLWRK